MQRKRTNFSLEQRKQSIKEANKILSLAKAALVMVGDISAITVSSFWPHPYYHTFCDHRKKSFSSTLYHLQKSGLIKRGGNGGKFFILTDRGEKECKKILSRIGVEKTKSEIWDGNWRVLIFDIPEKYKKYRNFLRAELTDYGFEMLQKSVWISPYKIAENLREVIENLGISKWVKLMVVETLFDDEELKKKFKLNN